MRVAGVVLGAPRAIDLARFYRDLLGWPIVTEEIDWVVIRPPGGGTSLSFQTEADHRPPVWPGGPDDQQMQVHLDVAVDDLGTAVSWALHHGATEAAFQPQDDVRVMLDPAGHPFCLFPGGEWHT